MHELQGDFFQHARERNEVWRILLGLFIIAVTYFAVIFATTIVLAWKGLDLYQVMMSGSPRGLALMLLSFQDMLLFLRFHPYLTYLVQVHQQLQLQISHT